MGVSCVSGLLLGFPGGSAGKESTWNVGDLGSTTGLGRSPGEGKGYSFQYSGLENSVDCIVRGRKELDTTELLSLHFTSRTVVRMHITLPPPWNLHHRTFLSPVRIRKAVGGKIDESESHSVMSESLQPQGL